MGTSQNLFGTSRTLPDDGDTNWGGEIRTILIDMMKAMDNMSSMLVDDLPFLVLKGADNTISDGGTLSVTNNRHDLVGSPGAVNLGAISTTLATGQALIDGQTLLLVGTNDTKTVELDSDTSGNWVLNGDVILGANDAVFLRWDSGQTKWLEVSRSN